MYIATSHGGYPAGPLMTGMSMSSAAIRTRVATRFGSGLAVGGAGVGVPIGGSVTRGDGVGVAAAVGRGEGLATGSAATGTV